MVSIAIRLDVILKQVKGDRGKRTKVTLRTHPYFGVS